MSKPKATQKTQCYMVFRKKIKQMKAMKAMKAKKAEKATLSGGAVAATKIVQWDENEAYEKKVVFFLPSSDGWERAPLFVPGREGLVDGVRGELFGCWKWDAWALWPH